MIVKAAVAAVVVFRKSLLERNFPPEPFLFRFLLSISQKLK
jgi:hypothetical protein